MGSSFVYIIFVIKGIIEETGSGILLSNGNDLQFLVGGREWIITAILRVRDQLVHVNVIHYKDYFFIPQMKIISLFLK